jgi:hypothetical protein
VQGLPSRLSLAFLSGALCFALIAARLAPVGLVRLVFLDLLLGWL